MGQRQVRIDTASPQHRFSLRRNTPIGCFGAAEAAQIVKADLRAGQRRSDPVHVSGLR